MATYKPKNVLTTGAAGFIASHFANRLIRSYPDYKIVVLDKLDYCSNLKNLNPSKLSPNFKFVKGDIGSADLVNYLLITESIDTIMHFAAQTHVDNSFGNSFEFTMNNVYGTHVLLEACKVTGQIRRFIHVSTAEVYGETDEDAVVRILIFTHTKKEKSFATSFSALPCYQDSFSNILKIENYEAGYWIVPSGDG